MQVIQKDHLTQLLRLHLPGDPSHWGHLTARVKATQPCGYALEVDCTLACEGKRAEIEIRYPLMDDGAWEQVSGPASNHLFKMGGTTFSAEILNDGAPIVTETMELDQDQLYANSPLGRLHNDFPPGFIECAALRPVCIDHDEVPVTIRLKTERMSACRVRMDVVARRGSKSLVEPIELDLSEAAQIVRFEHAGWRRGEYWIRVQLVEDGRPFGPYMVRKFWKELIGPDVKPEPPLNLGGALQYMCDDWLFEEVKGVDFWPMSYDPNPDGPALEMDRPWEFGIMNMRSLNYDEDEGLYKLEYTSDPESYYRRGFGWHLLVDDLSSEDDQPDNLRLILGTGHFRNIRKSRTQSTVAKNPVRTGYEGLLKRLLDQGSRVKEFHIPPDGCSHVILQDPRPEQARNTDHLMLSVPGIRPDGGLLPLTEIDESRAEIFELYPEDLNRPNHRCLATSRNGVDWEKPELGRVDFHGSKANNILGTAEDAIREIDPEGVTASVTLGVNTPKFKFRKFDEERDGPVDPDRVFMALIANGRNPKIDFMWPDDFEGSMDELGFEPVYQERDWEDHQRGTEDWDFGVDTGSKRLCRSYYPMMYKGNNEYLFLTDEALIHRGPGMDLMHSNETIREQIERRDEPTLFWYYRPGTPGYPPHNMPWDNFVGDAQRNLAVMWTDDGIHFHKRACVSPDEFDAPGMQFYNMGLILEQPASHHGRTMLRGTSSSGRAVNGGEMYLAELRSYPTYEHTQYPELMWSRDLLHWHRFRHHRAPMIKLSEEEGSYNWGMYFQGRSYYPYKDKDGRDAWWLHNTAITGRHNHSISGNASLEERKARLPHFSEAPYFVDWETNWQRGLRMRYAPLFTHIRPGRLAYAAPTGGAGEVTTHPIRFDGDDLCINAQVENGGSLGVEVLKEDGSVLDGYRLADFDSFAGDEVDHRPSWGGRGLADLGRRSLKVRIVLENARLFSLQII